MTNMNAGGVFGQAAGAAFGGKGTTIDDINGGASEEVPEGENNFCPKCGAASKGANFCPKCGTKLN